MNLRQTISLYCYGAGTAPAGDQNYVHFQPPLVFRPPSLETRNKGNYVPVDDPMEDDDRYFDVLKRKAASGELPANTKSQAKMFEPDARKRAKQIRKNLQDFQSQYRLDKYRKGLTRKNSNPPALPAQTTLVAPHSSVFIPFATFR